MLFSRDRAVWIAAFVAVGLAMVHVIWFFASPGLESREFFAAFYTPFVSTLAGLMLLFAAWRLRQSNRRAALAWTLLGAAQLFTAIGDVTWYVIEILQGEPPSPSLADVFYLLNYPIFLLGVLQLAPKSVFTRQWVKTTIDMTILLLTTVLMLWNYLLAPLLSVFEGSRLLLFITMAYPTGDLLLVWALLVVLYRYKPGAGMRYFRLLAAGLVMTIIYDLIFLYQTVVGIAWSGSWADLIYTLAFLTIGLSGWYQAIEPQDLQAIQVANHSRLPLLEVMGKEYSWKVYLPYIWLAIAYVMLVYAPKTSMVNPNAEYLSIGLIIFLVLVRQVLTMRENRQLNTTLRDTLTQVQYQSFMLEKANHEMQVEIQERKRIENRLVYDALHDPLTGLPNRALFLDRLAHAGRQKKRHPQFGYAVLFLDLDSFKLVNDSLGHIAGDHLLVYMAQALQDCLRTTDTVARLGGDEFVILLEDIQADDAVRTAERLQEVLSKPVQIDGNRVFVSVSIGIVQNIDGYEAPEEVLRDADLAMYHAKARGKARYEIFQTDMRASVITRLALENDLHRALDQKEFTLHYQPILSLPGQRLVAFEALVRWNHPERGLLLPVEFISVAEETGLILSLGRWILQEACHQAQRWIARYPQLSDIKVSVNISGKQLKQPDFIEPGREALAETGLPAANLALEVTESVCIDHLDAVADTLKALESLGVETQIDDFGTGYSSLSYLQRLPVKSIKIDRCFIQSIQEDHSDAPDLARAIFSMINGLGIRSVAEGIETELQLSELSRLNCSYVQGFYLAVPMDEGALESWLQSSHVLPGKSNFFRHAASDVQPSGE